MTKKLFSVLGVFCFVCLAAHAQKPDKKIENGVEVIVNHLQPYGVAKGELTTLNLEKELSIDLAREDITKLGLADIYNFGVDSAGNIYVLKGKSVECFIFKFDGKGHFLKSFGKKGQGPGELQWTQFIRCDSQDNIIVSDPEIRKNLVFDPQGNLVRETAFPKDVYALYPLYNGRSISYWRKWTSPTNDHFDDYFGLSGPGLKGVRVLDSCQWPNPRKHGIRGNRLNRVFSWKTSGSRIYIGNEDRGYEFLVFDLEGNLLRKIRKDPKPFEVQLSEDDKKKIIEERPGLKVAFPEFWPPFGSFFVDDENRLYVQTYEKGENQKNYLYDIFSQKGIFVFRKSLPIKPAVDIEGDAVVQKDRLYCVQEKESGYKELVVYRMMGQK